MCSLKAPRSTRQCKKQSKPKCACLYSSHYFKENFEILRDAAHDFSVLGLGILLACSEEFAFDDHVPLSLHIQLVYFGGSSDTNFVTC